MITVKELYTLLYDEMLHGNENAQVVVKLNQAPQPPNTIAYSEISNTYAFINQDKNIFVIYPEDKVIRN